MWGLPSEFRWYLIPLQRQTALPVYSPPCASTRWISHTSRCDLMMAGVALCQQGALRKAKNRKVIKQKAKHIRPEMKRHKIKRIEKQKV